MSNHSSRITGWASVRVRHACIRKKEGNLLWVTRDSDGSSMCTLTPHLPLSSQLMDAVMLQLARARNRLTTPASMTLPELATSGLMVKQNKAMNGVWRLSLSLSHSHSVSLSFFLTRKCSPLRCQGTSWWTSTSTSASCVWPCTSSMCCSQTPPRQGSGSTLPWPQPHLAHDVNPSDVLILSVVSSTVVRV